MIMCSRDRNREQLRPPGIYYLVKKYAYEARIEKITPHTLRHTFGKNLVDAGVPLDRIATLLGHSSLNTTRIYTVPSQADLQDAVETIATGKGNWLSAPRASRLCDCPRTGHCASSHLSSFVAFCCVLC